MTKFDFTKKDYCLDCNHEEFWHSENEPIWYGKCHSCSSKGETCLGFKVKEESE